LRVAVSGGAVSPPIDQTVALLGREVALKRIDRALEFIDKTPAP
jgi:glutamyl-tRNA synthetase